MDYVEIQKVLEDLGVKISIGTLYRYRRVGLLPEAEKGHGGRGRGPSINFPPEAVAEAYAAKKLFEAEPRPKTETVAEARRVALEALENKKLLSLTTDELGTRVYPWWYVCGMALKWLIHREKIIQGMKPETIVHTHMTNDSIELIPWTGRKGENVEKGDWRDETELALCNKLDEEVQELFEAVYNYRANPTPETQQRVREEAGDVVNVVMMLADKCGALEEHRWEGTD